MVEINFSNKTRQTIDPEPFFGVIRSVLKKYSITDNVETELTIIGSTAMQRLNRTYRQKDYPTDVLSFPIWPDLATIQSQLKQGPISIGSIVICLPVATRDAAAEQQTLDDKLAFLIEHSLLHLMGYHHEGD